MAIDLDTRKCIHLRFSTGVHASFKVECERRNLSMQLVLEELAKKVVEEDPYIIDILNGIQLKRFENKIRFEPKISINHDVDSLYEYFDKADKDKIK